MHSSALPPYHYVLFFDPPSGEYVAECQEVPGLSGVGATEMTALIAVKEAVAGWLDVLAEDGLPIPAPEPTSIPRLVLEGVSQ